MKNWWKRSSLKLRLAVWHAAATTVVLAVFAAFVYEVVEHRLAAEIDRQLRIDFDLIEAQLETDAGGSIHWLVEGVHGEGGVAGLWGRFGGWGGYAQLL